MAQQLQIDQQLVHQVMAELESTRYRLDRSRAALVRLEEASFGSSEIGARAQQQTEAAATAVEETIASLDQVHTDLVAALVVMRTQAEAADGAGGAALDQLRRATEAAGSASAAGGASS